MTYPKTEVLGKKYIAATPNNRKGEMEEKELK